MTPTGRDGTSGPNMQNIPLNTPEVAAIKEALPMPSSLPKMSGKCDICSKDSDELFVCASAVGSITLAHCRDCLTEGAEPLFVVDTALWGGFHEDGTFSAAALHPGFMEGTSVYFNDRYMSVSDYIQQPGVIDRIRKDVEEYNKYVADTGPAGPYIDDNF